jgi:hypothetical protein
MAHHPMSSVKQQNCESKGKWPKAGRVHLDEGSGTGIQVRGQTNNTGISSLRILFELTRKNNDPYLRFPGTRKSFR